MAGETVTTVVGNVTADPEIRYTPSGAAVASFTIASTPRSFDRASGQWKDGEALFLRCCLWRAAAENAAESLQRGTRVIAQGRLQQRSFETREGRSGPPSSLLSMRSGRHCGMRASPSTGSTAGLRRPPRRKRTCGATGGPTSRCRLAEPCTSTARPRPARHG